MEGINKEFGIDIAISHAVFKDAGECLWVRPIDLITVKVRATPEWKKFMADGAFNQTFMTGKEFRNWLTLNEALHKQLMGEAGFLAK
ncbi:hypothetical protein [Polynucleobacter necessarius]|uniref:hypothetical protein n=1 Tax=Polynucleobacter necessarius TaxID=576610 RepID=UPI0018D5863A